MKRTLLAALAITLGLGAHAAPGQAYRIEHMEPAFWWTGMQQPALQLMVHGKGIADLDVSLNYPGVRLASVARVANRNYLFLNLEIDTGAQPGKFDIAFTAPGKGSLLHTYELLARAPGSAQRQGFTSADVIYQVMPDRFANGNPANDTVAGMPDKLDRKSGSGRHGGDLQGMSNALDYIAGMGYTMLWPTPLVENNMPGYSYHGYSGTDLYQIDARYGGNEEFRAFTGKARGKGIGVIQDVVLNHIGMQHWWMRDLPTPDWITHQGKYVPTQHHRVALQDPYAAQQDRDDFTQGWFSPNMPDLNQANPYLATYLIQNSLWWIEYAGLAGLRVDTYGYSNPAFLADWSRRIMAEYPRLNLVGEEWSNQIPVVAHWLRGKQNADGYISSMPGMMDFPLNDVLREVLRKSATTGKSEPGAPGLNALYEALSQDYLYPQPDNMVLFEGNHDMARTFSVLNHDDALFRIAMAYVLTMPRIPQLYYGTEIQMTSSTEGRDDPSYRQDFPGGWAGDKVNAFTGEGLSAQQLAAQAYLKKLLNWRKGQSVIHHGKLMHYGPEDNTYVYFRHDGERKVMVAINLNPQATTLKTARFHEMLQGVAGGNDVISGQRIPLQDQLTLPARSAMIVELDRTRGTVSKIDNIVAPQLGNSRSLRIYLPPSYGTRSDLRYPVLYMHDGQNLFDARSAAYGVEWGIDETMDRLIAEGKMAEAIVVGIDNTPERIAEYTPCCDPQHGGGKLEQYESFIVDTVKPYIDRTYRTLPGKEHTALMGSSLGGIASVHMAAHRVVFPASGRNIGSHSNGTRDGALILRDML